MRGTSWFSLEIKRSQFWHQKWRLSLWHLLDQNVSLKPKAPLKSLLRDLDMQISTFLPKTSFHIFRDCSIFSLKITLSISTVTCAFKSSSRRLKEVWYDHHILYRQVIWTRSTKWLTDQNFPFWARNWVGDITDDFLAGGWQNASLLFMHIVKPNMGMYVCVFNIYMVQGIVRFEPTSFLIY